MPSRPPNRTPAQRAAARRIESVAKWIGAPLPDDAPFQATPQVLVDLLDERRIPFEDQEVLRRLLDRVRLAGADKLHRLSLRKLGREWRTDRATLARRMRRLARAGLIVFQPKPDELAPVVDLAPLRTAVIEYYAKRHGGSAVEPRGATSESGGSTNTPSGCTDTAARGAITEPVVAPSANQSWLDGAATTGGGSGSKTPHRREKSEEAEEGGAALHAPEGLPGDLRRFLEQKGIAVPGRGR